MTRAICLLNERVSGYDLRVEGDERVREIISERDSVLRDLNRKLAEQKRRVASEARIVFPDRSSLEKEISGLMGESYEIASPSDKGAIPLIPAETLASYMDALKTYGSELAGPPTDKAVWTYKCGSDGLGCGYVLGSPLQLSKSVFHGKSSRLITTWNCRVCQGELEKFR